MSRSQKTFVHLNMRQNKTKNNAVDKRYASPRAKKNTYATLRDMPPEIQMALLRIMLMRYI